jgi:K+ transporter
LALIGAGLLLGDGVITPSISVLSALEGLEVVGASTDAVVPVTCILLVGLFCLQQFGTAKVGVIFGPVMVRNIQIIVVNTSVRSFGLPPLASLEFIELATILIFWMP